MRVYTKKTTAWGVFRSDSPPPKWHKSLFKIGGFCFLSLPLAFIAFILSGMVNFFAGLIAAIIASIPSFLFFRCIKWEQRAYEQFCEEVREKEAAFMKENPFYNEEIFYKKCKEANADNVSVAGIARMKLVAGQMGINCSDAELSERYLQGKNAAAMRALADARKESNKRVAELLKIEQAQANIEKKYIEYKGPEKRNAMLMDMRTALQEHLRKCEEHERWQKAEASRRARGVGTSSDWATAGGIASAIAGPAAGAAVAIDMQLKDAQARAVHQQNQAILGPLSTMAMINTSNSVKACQERIARCEKEITKTKLKLWEERSEDELLRALAPKIASTERSESGSVTFKIKTSATNITIYETVHAIVDGTFKIDIMYHGEKYGEAFCSLPISGADRELELTATCASLPEKTLYYDYVVVPYHLWVIEKMDQV